MHDQAQTKKSKQNKPRRREKPMAADGLTFFDLACHPRHVLLCKQFVTWDDLSLDLPEEFGRGSVLPSGKGGDPTDSEDSDRL